MAEPRPATAFRLLSEFADSLAAHLDAEDGFLTGPAQVGQPEFRAFCDAHAARFSDLVAKWNGYLSDWTQDRIARDWNGFGSTTAWMMKRLKEQIEAENDTLYPLALAVGLIRFEPR